MTVAYRGNLKSCGSQTWSVITIRIIIQVIESNEHIYIIIQAKKRANRKGQYMLYNFGKVHEFKKKSNTDYQINFITDKVRRSLITIRLEADSLKMVVNKLATIPS